MRLLVVKPSSLGDIVHTMPAVAELRAAIPGVEITWVANDSLSALVGLCPGITILPFPRKALGKFSWTAFRSFWDTLRTISFDAVLDFQGLLRSGLISWLARSPKRYGFANARECAPFFYTNKVVLPKELRHAAEKNLFLARTFLKEQGFAVPETPVETPTRIPGEWQAEAEMLVQEHHLSGGPLLAVGCSSRWNSKSWSVEYFGEVLRGLSAQRPDVRIWLLGAPEECERAEAVRTASGLEQVANLAGKTSMGALVALLARSRTLFTNDSGPMHIAALLGVPCVANFGSTDPTLTGPYGPEGRHEIIHTLCEKSPCFCRECPRGDNALCCAGVSRDAVVSALLKRLS